MDYKKIIKNRNVRIWLTNLLNFIPDKPMISFQYRIKTGRFIRWNNPQRFTEKLQIYKLHTTPLMAQCVDKYEVRRYVEKIGLSECLVPLIGIYKSPEEIDFDEIPDRFVAKDTLGCGGNSVFICKDKTRLNRENFIKTCNTWINEKRKHPGREHVYDDKQHRIIIEEFINPDNVELGIIDYKFFCFHGKAKYLYVVGKRSVGKGAEFTIKDSNYNTLPFYRVDEKKPSVEIPKPDNYDKLKETAEKLAGQFPEVRVDLYDEKGKILFGELTFFDGSGYMRFEPDNFDYILGREFDLSMLEKSVE